MQNWIKLIKKKKLLNWFNNQSKRSLNAAVVAYCFDLAVAPRKTVVKWTHWKIYGTLYCDEECISHVVGHRCIELIYVYALLVKDINSN